METVVETQKPAARNFSDEEDADFSSDDAELEVGEEEFESGDDEFDGGGIDGGE